MIRENPETPLGRSARIKLIIAGTGSAVLLAVVLFLRLQIEPESAQKGLRSLINGAGCAAPCWQTLEPGVSTVEIVDNLLAGAGVDPYVIPRLEGGPLIYSWQHDDFQLVSSNSENRRSASVVFDDEGLIIRMLIDAHFCISTMLDEYGVPPEVRLGKGSGGSGLGDYEISYPEEGLIFIADDTYVFWVIPTTLEEINLIVLSTEPIENWVAGENDCVDGFS